MAPSDGNLVAAGAAGPYGGQPVTESSNTESTKLQDSIVEAALRDPWASTYTIAERTGASRPYAGQVVRGHGPSNRARKVAKDGLEVGGQTALEELIDLLEDQGYLEEPVAEAFLSAASTAKLEAIEIEFRRSG